MKKKLNVAILYGGRSVEHEISIRSAKNVVFHIDKEIYNLILLGIDKNGSWYLVDSIDNPISSGKQISINLNASRPYLVEGNSGKTTSIDIAFPVLHGTDGEDGSIQGLFKAMDLPVVGSGVLGSAVSMDKIISKKILKECGIPVAEYIEFDRSEKDQIEFEKVAKKVGLPFMIKSSALGSSVGVSLVKSADDFEGALNESFRYDEKVIIEQFIKGRELECAVMGNDNPTASYPGEIVMVKDYDFYTYEAKYLDEDAIRIDLPAKIDEETSEKIRKFSIQAYLALRCEDFARVDLFLTEDGNVIVNEINTIPGFTSASMFPMMWQHMGIEYKTLISKLIDLSLNRYKESKRIETDYIGN